MFSFGGNRENDRVCMETNGLYDLTCLLVLHEVGFNHHFSFYEIEVI